MCEITPDCRCSWRNSNSLSLFQNLTFFRVLISLNLKKNKKMKCCMCGKHSLIHIFHKIIEYNIWFQNNNDPSSILFLHDYDHQLYGNHIITIFNYNSSKKVLTIKMIFGNRSNKLSTQEKIKRWKSIFKSSKQKSENWTRTILTKTYFVACKKRLKNKLNTFTNTLWIRKDSSMFFLRCISDIENEKALISLI